MESEEVTITTVEMPTRMSKEVVPKPAFGTDGEYIKKIHLSRLLAPRLPSGLGCRLLLVA
jgi:hypothetical protein